MNRELRQFDWASNNGRNHPAGLQFRRLLPRTWTSIVSLMRKGRESWTTGILPIAVLIAMLLTLIVLQFRWSREVSEAERDRLEQNLNRSTASFQSAFARDLLGLCRSLQTPQTADSKDFGEEILDRYGAWSRVSGRAAMVDGIYLHRQASPSAILEFNLKDRKLAAAAWPAPIENALAQNADTVSERPNEWIWDGQMPGLIHPLYLAGGAAASHGRTHPRLYGYLFVLFDAKYFESHYLPEIARRAFPATSGFEFQIVQQTHPGSRDVIYRSSSTVPGEAFRRTDAVASPFPQEGLIEQRTGDPGSILIASRPPTRWILVRHHAGSVEAAAAALRHRNLGISIAVLLVLAASMLIIVLTTLRARRLARLEMEFATGVSHELRTPLAVIRSAAENLADGVVTETSRVREYGAMIHREGRRLSTMVEHILDFAALHSDARKYHLTEVRAASMIEAVAAGFRLQAEAADMTIESSVPDDLPLLESDPGALRQCLENLIGNAVKYGKSGRLIRIAASLDRKNPGEVSISVRDYGPGISAADLPYIFDPFYRGAGVRTSPIRGTGLGLSLTREMIEALGGRISVENLSDRGAMFTLHIPTVAAPAVPENPDATTEDLRTS